MSKPGARRTRRTHASRDDAKGNENVMLWQCLTCFASIGGHSRRSLKTLPRGGQLRRSDMFIVRASKRSCSKRQRGGMEMPIGVHAALPGLGQDRGARRYYKHVAPLRAGFPVARRGELSPEEWFHQVPNRRANDFQRAAGIELPNPLGFGGNYRFVTSGNAFEEAGPRFLDAIADGSGGLPGRASFFTELEGQQEHQREIRARIAYGQINHLLHHLQVEPAPVALVGKG